MTEINVYCDESCHLPNDRCTAMSLGAIWVPKEEVRRTALDIRRIKRSFGLSPSFEIKWTKVSQAKIEFYESLINYFFDESSLHFRVIVIPDKRILRHEEFDQTHDDWYYKMYFRLLKVLISPEDRYSIYLDIKDTCSSLKVARLHSVLCNSVYDFSGDIIQKIQTVRSNEVEQIQLTDLLTGLFSYYHRGLKTNSAKLRLIELL